MRLTYITFNNLLAEYHESDLAPIKGMSLISVLIHKYSPTTHIIVTERM